eukprot:CAMPEP_0118662168 /NCGR_PEP_ID=MMETSP0785-20121206/16675_1 /TAXON_ID=91992 /ORGANISM="Bolidomonas pacifica, Strain CCMP 1866" /LENGTH=149 /DNA_ID=CAMNT_0006555669 /DNA_START=239 /DNA_END=684 /DNA_ORIENTATION=-
MTNSGVRFATKKAGGSSKNGRDSPGQRLGLKLTAGQYTNAGGIIARQRGLKYMAGAGVGVGKDHTLFATKPGYLMWTNVTPRKIKKSLLERWARPMTKKKKVAHIVDTREEAMKRMGENIFMPKVFGKGPKKNIVYSPQSLDWDKIMAA